MLTKLEHEGYWPSFLTYKDCNLMIRLSFKREIESKYSHKVQKLYKSSGFN